MICGLAAVLAAPGVLAACSSGDGEYEGAQSTTTTDVPAGASVPLAQVPVGGGTLVRTDGDPVLVVQPTPGTVKAFDAKCPHQGTTVDPPQGGVITCPNHFSQFDAATGALRRGPAQTGLTEVPVRVPGDTVQVT